MNRRHSQKREQILSVLKKHGGALSAQDLHQQLPELDLATIYRNLALFVEDGEIRKLHLSDKEALYEYQTKPHHHAVCSQCDRVIHFNIPEAKIKKLLDLTDFSVEEVELTVKGTCQHKPKKS
jgi:Fur family transcriptional regulator, peroxide stress response regulator